MLEIQILSLFVGSLGLQAVIASGWLRWQQLVRQDSEEEEEEILTRYESKENAASAEQRQSNGSAKPASKDPRLVGWEFKIVRAKRDLFHDPAIFQRMCKEEADAGWILLEKLDDRRVRFKRPMALREIVKSDFLPVDPYRCHYGPSSNSIAWLGAIAALTAIVLPAYLGFMLVSTTLANSRSKTPAAPIQNSPSLSIPKAP